jgi:hypothetical protein
VLQGRAPGAPTAVAQQQLLGVVTKEAVGKCVYCCECCFVLVMGCVCMCKAHTIAGWVAGLHQAPGRRIGVSFNCACPVHPSCRHLWHRIYKDNYGQPSPEQLLPLPGEAPLDYGAPTGLELTPGEGAGAGRAAGTAQCSSRNGLGHCFWPPAAVTTDGCASDNVWRPWLCKPRRIEHMRSMLG